MLGKNIICAYTSSIFQYFNILARYRYVSCEVLQIKNAQARYMRLVNTNLPCHTYLRWKQQIYGLRPLKIGNILCYS